MSTKPDICELNMDELKAAMKELGEPAFRASQVYDWLHVKNVVSFDAMSNLSAALRAKLKESFRITEMNAAETFVSRIDGTRKYVFVLWDGNAIEAVLMRYKHGNSVCISSQVGCRMGCRFCASTLDGCVRDLSAAEMLAEVYRIGSDIGERISNVVIMGSGEPLDNYDEVVKFLRMITDEKGLHISARNITLSTCGLTEKIRALAEEGLPVTLALSLHAPSQEKREEIMPVAKAYPLQEVLGACRYYYHKTHRRLSFEYSVVKGVNDTGENALALAALLNTSGFGEENGGQGKGRGGRNNAAGRSVHALTGGREGMCHVNLIPVNPIEEREYESPDRRTVEEFQHILMQNGINATIRREMGRDISSACGQLRRRYFKNAGPGSD
ncbi:MAG: 23S rRNA (adenine(2503)-C(2))-methyltransferase RlmN [Lachnospiraceae bacterium]|nr:23S rRNA (adenine(2503)-C(2))-methyltransferase RlmN [Lachnospiraceae bacterium]